MTSQVVPKMKERKLDTYIFFLSNILFMYGLHYIILYYIILYYIILYSIIRGVFRNNVDFFNNFTMLCSMVINNISICFRIFLPSIRRV